MKKLFKYTFLFIIIYLSYLSFDFYWTFLEVTSNKSLKLPIKGEYEIFVKDTKPYISLSGVGVKLNGVREKNNSFNISHNEPIYITFNPFLSKLIFCYDGLSKIKYNKKKSSLNFNNFKTESNISYVINMDFKLATFSGILQNPQSVIKHVKSIEFFHNNILLTRLSEKKDNNQKSNNNPKNILVFHSNNSYYKLSADLQHLNSFTDFLTNPPKEFSVSSKINISNTKKENSALPISIIYGIIPNINLSGNIDSKLKFEIDKIKFANKPNLSKNIPISFKYLKSNLNTSLGKIDIFAKTDFGSKDKTIHIDSKFTLKDRAYEYLPKWYVNLVRTISSFNNYTNFLSQKVNTRSFPKFETDTLFTFKLDTNYKILKDSIDLKIENFIFASESGSALLLSGKSFISRNLEYFITAEVILKKAKLIINYANEYIQKITRNRFSKDDEINELDNEIAYNFAKKLSNYPDSNSKDFLYTIDINSKENKFKIGNYDKMEIMNLFFKTKTEMILDNAKRKADPEAFLEKVAPNVKNELKQLLPKTNKIGNKLWKKLIK